MTDSLDTYAPSTGHETTTKYCGGIGSFRGLLSRGNPMKARGSVPPFTNHTTYCRGVENFRGFLLRGNPMKDEGSASSFTDPSIERAAPPPSSVDRHR